MRSDSPRRKYDSLPPPKFLDTTSREGFANDKNGHDGTGFTVHRSPHQNHSEVKVLSPRFDDIGKITSPKESPTIDWSLSALAKENGTLGSLRPPAENKRNLEVKVCSPRYDDVGRVISPQETSAIADWKLSNMVRGSILQPPTGGSHGIVPESVEDFIEGISCPRFQLWMDQETLFGMMHYQKNICCEILKSKQQELNLRNGAKEEWLLVVYKGLEKEAPVVDRMPLSQFLLRKGPNKGDLRLFHTARRQRPYCLLAESEHSVFVSQLLARLCAKGVLYDATVSGGGSRGGSLQGSPRSPQQLPRTSSKRSGFHLPLAFHASIRHTMSDDGSMMGPLSSKGHSGPFFDQVQPISSLDIHRLLMRAHAHLWRFEVSEGEELLGTLAHQCPVGESEVAQAWASYMRAESYFLQCFMSGDVRALTSTQDLLDETLDQIGVVYESTRSCQAAKKRGRARTTQVLSSSMVPSSFQAPQVAEQFMLIHAHATCLKVLLLMWMNKPMKAVWLGKTLIKKVVSLGQNSVQIGPLLEFPPNEMQKRQEEMRFPKIEMEAAAYGGSCWYGFAHHVRFISGLFHCALSTLPDAASSLLGRMIGINSDFTFGQELLRKVAREAGMMRPLAGVFLNVFHYIQSASPENKKPFPTGKQWQVAAEQIFSNPPLGDLPIQRFLQGKMHYQKHELPKCCSYFLELDQIAHGGSHFPLHMLKYYAGVAYIFDEQWSKALGVFSTLVSTLEPFSDEMHYIRLSAAAHCAGLEAYDSNQARRKWMQTALTNAAGTQLEDHMMMKRIRSYLKRGEHGLDLWLFELFYILHPSQMRTMPKEWHMKLLKILERGPTPTNAIKKQKLKTAQEIDALALHLYLRAMILYFADEGEEATKIFGSFVSRPPQASELQWSYFVVQNSFYYHALITYKMNPTLASLRKSIAVLEKGLQKHADVYECTNKMKHLLNELKKMNMSPRVNGSTNASER